MNVLLDSLLKNGLTASGFLICTAAALACGILTACAASFRCTVSKSFVISLVLLPIIVETVILMVNGNIGTGVAVMGAFSLVRFRSVPGRARDIVAIFLAMTAGLACAAGYAVIALIVTSFVSLAFVVMALIPFAEERQYELRITIPESLDYSEAFDETFKKYTKNAQLLTTKTTNMGSLFKNIYRIEFKDERKSREFINELRCKNGNLEIALSRLGGRNEEL